MASPLFHVLYGRHLPAEEARPTEGITFST